MSDLGKKNFQLLRGDTAQNDAYIGPEGSLSVDYEKDELRLHDGITPGGTVIGSGGGGSLTEVPDDGQFYVRGYGAWEPVTLDGGTLSSIDETPLAPRKPYGGVTFGSATLG